jgi:hypothetical protein
MVINICWRVVSNLFRLPFPHPADFVISSYQTFVKLESGLCHKGHSGLLHVGIYPFGAPCHLILTMGFPQEHNAGLGFVILFPFSYA